MPVKLKAQQRVRKTQAERSAETRQLLIDATIDSLLAKGYVATSTTAIAERAGVTRGAQIHHFPKKLDLIEAAFIHVAEEARQEYVALLEEVPKDIEPADAVVELLWKRYQGRYFWAYIELALAARTDESLRTMLKGIDKVLEKTAEDFCTRLFGQNAGRNRKLMSAINMSIRFMSGLAFAAIVKDANWRKRAMQNWQELIVPVIKTALQEGAEQ